MCRAPHVPWCLFYHRRPTDVAGEGANGAGSCTNGTRNAACGVAGFAYPSTIQPTLADLVVFFVK
jgi:hypothetical protein